MEPQKVLPTTDELYKLVKENNQMLKSMRRSAFIGGILKFVFWILLLFVVPYVMYVVYVQPYVERALETAQAFQENVDSVNAQVSGLPDFGKLIEQFTGGSSETE
ncbi:hypothetical protein COU15_01750 [Candidatus Kaiserbacteria bacterium CG10_big_fil_rev_8_21_14_0_10_45_20]|uniref:Uncharacterized protein n=1 Tax=Candidatus Kaiserbacteria bacterium CG10_big_fil_rev_8_21_14_0_10_45_20 TaxID=1974607 RepID=A0A2H0UHH8_9BACT|nr:MAG: hypothetical protein COU15_01750 [Candidatus Kaiserbacteria bacterium CG10_big_fil_rev_8_21_14_0_10_45_20]